jgi:hypothetical protein
LVHCGRLVKEALRVGIEWPVSNKLEVVQAFAKRVVQFVGTGFRIKGKNAQDSAFAGGICRKVFLATSEFVPAVFDACSMSDMMTWTHDEGAYVDPLKPMSGAELRERFGMQPLMIGYWASQLSSCDPRAQQALQQADDTRLLHVLAELRSEESRVPTPDTIARRLLELDATT